MERNDWLYWLNQLLQLELSRFRVPVLNGQCHEIYKPRFFRDSNPSFPLIHMLKYFHIYLRFADIFKCAKIFAASLTAESSSVSGACRCPWHSGVKNDFGIFAKDYFCNLKIQRHIRKCCLNPKGAEPSFDGSLS